MSDARPSPGRMMELRDLVADELMLTDGEAEELLAEIDALHAEIDRLRAAEAAARADERARFAPLLEACQPQLKDSAGSFYERVQRALRELERGDHIAGEGGGHG
jgi:hypothetical protein